MNRCSCAAPRSTILCLRPPECYAGRRERALKRVIEIESEPAHAAAFEHAGTLANRRTHRAWKIFAAADQRIERLTGIEEALQFEKIRVVERVAHRRSRHRRTRVRHTARDVAGRIELCFLERVRNARDAQIDLGKVLDRYGGRRRGRRRGSRRSGRWGGIGHGGRFLVGVEECVELFGINPSHEMVVRLYVSRQARGVRPLECSAEPEEFLCHARRERGQDRGEEHA